MPDKDENTGRPKKKEIRGMGCTGGKYKKTGKDGESNALRLEDDLSGAKEERAKSSGGAEGGRGRRK